MRYVARLVCAIASVALFCLGLPGGAQAATVTVGSPIPTTSSFGVFLCGSPAGCAFTQLSLDEPTALVQAPFDGVILRWRIKGAKVGLPGYSVRALRESAPGSLEFSDVGASAPATPEGTGIQTFASHLPIQAGDYVGLVVPNTGTMRTNDMSGTFGSMGAALTENGRATATPTSGEMLFNADVKPTPTVTLIGPASGPVTGGTPVMIAGSDFNGVSAVRFGAVAAPTFTVDSEAKITAVAPAATSPGAVDVSVTTDAGTSAATSGDRFEYVAPPAPPPSCLVPNLKGKKLKAAKKSAKKANCAVGKVKKLGGAPAKTGKVSGQSPKAGKTAPAGTKITVQLR